MTRRKAPESATPTLPPDRALRAIADQLAKLETFNGRKAEEAEFEEQEWEHFTQSIIEGAFGKPSSNLNKFYAARSAGHHNVFGISPQENQSNFEQRIAQYKALLRSLINELQLHLPEMQSQGIYQAGDDYAFYRDLISLIEKATTLIFIVDAYLDESVFNLYVDKVSGGTGIRILSNKIGTNVQSVAAKCARSKTLELRSSVSVHDRLVFIDDRGWAIGQSIKDAAQTKPTYMIELTEPSLSAVRDAHNTIWTTAIDII